MENYDTESVLPVVIMSGDHENVQGIEIIGDNVAVMSGHQINLIDLNIFTHPVENQAVEDEQRQSSSSHEILRQSKGEKLVTYKIFTANDIGSEKQESTSSTAEKMSSKQVYIAEIINQEENKDERGDNQNNDERGDNQIFFAEKIDETNPQSLNKEQNGTSPENVENFKSCIDEGNNRPTSSKTFKQHNPVFHGLKGKPSNKGTAVKNKDKRNLFESLALCATENHIEDSGTVCQNNEITKLEDSLKRRCLNDEAVVKLVPLDKQTISFHCKKQNTTKQHTDILIPKKPKKVEMLHLKKPKKVEIIKKKNVMIKREFTCVYGKKKKKKVSVQLLREIDKEPGERFNKKEPRAKKLWKKIEKMEKSGVNWKKKQGRVAITGEFPCSHCDYVAIQKSHLQAHQSIHVKKWQSCKFCKFQTRSDSKLLEHEARHTGDKPFRCDFEGCEYAGVCKGDLSKHKRKHQEDKPYKCPHCDFVTKWPRNIKHHLLRHTDDRPYKCKQCGFAFKRQTDLNYHMYRHSDLKPIKCEQCDFRCKTNFEIKCHMLKHSDVRHFTCTYPGCEQKTKTKSDMTKHMKVHSKTLDFVCDLCGKGFKTKSSMKKHQLRHSEERPWKCDLCDRRFKIKPALRNHINMHAGYKPHSCEVCGMLFSSLSNMRTHMRVHSVIDRPLKCPICPYHGKTQDHILSHIGTMHGSQYAYFCEICKKPFKRYHLLQVHYPRCHTKEEMAFMENTLKLNIQAIKSEVVDEISKEELAKRNADLNWDCIVVKDERVDPAEVQNTKQEDIETMENNKREQSQTTSAEMNGHVDSGQIQKEETKMEIKIAKSESLDSSTDMPKAATLAIYDGFRLPLATVGFHFNFIKKGKKTKAWFMDQNLMDETARERHIKYLKRKQEEVLFGYYSSKRRRGVKSQKRIRKGKAPLKIKSKIKQESNKMNLKRKGMPKIAMAPGSSQTQKIEAEKWLNISIKKSMSELKVSSTQSKTSFQMKNDESKLSRNIEYADKNVTKIKNKSKKHQNVSKQQGKLKTKPEKKPNTSNISAKTKSGRPPKKVAKTTIKTKGKPGLKPNVNKVNLTKLKTKSHLHDKKMKAKFTKSNVQPKTNINLKAKGKQGSKPVVKTNSKALGLKKKSAGRKPQNNKNLTNTNSNKLSIKPKGKVGRPKKDSLTVKLPKPKGKPGRKPKIIKLDETMDQPVIKQEVMDDFDDITTAIDTLIENQSTIGVHTANSMGVHTANDIRNTSNMISLGTCMNDNYPDNSLMDRIKTKKRKYEEPLHKQPRQIKKPQKDIKITSKKKAKIDKVPMEDHETLHTDESLKTSNLVSESRKVPENLSNEIGCVSSNETGVKRKFFTKNRNEGSKRVTASTQSYTALLNSITSATLTATCDSDQWALPSSENQSIRNTSNKHLSLTPLTQLPSQLLEKVNIEEMRKEEELIQKKRQRKKQPQAEVVIENAEESDTEEIVVYPVSLQAAQPVPVSLQAPEPVPLQPAEPVYYTKVIVKDEYNVQLREMADENNQQVDNHEYNVQLRDMADENNQQVDNHDTAVASYCDDVSVMRNSFDAHVNSTMGGCTISQDQLNTFAKTGELVVNAPSHVSSLGLQIQNDSAVETNCNEVTYMVMENEVLTQSNQTGESDIVPKFSEESHDESVASVNVHSVDSESVPQNPYHICDKSLSNVGVQPVASEIVTEMSQDRNSEQSHKQNLTNMSDSSSSVKVEPTDKAFLNFINC